MKNYDILSCPFLWIWATLYKPKIGWGMKDHTDLEKLNNQLLINRVNIHLSLGGSFEK